MILDRDLSAHNRAERIDLHTWVSERISENSPAVDLYRFLVEKGTYFQYSYPPVLNGLILPCDTAPLQCHTNSTHYLCTVQEKQQYLLDDLYLVSGLYAMKANNDCVPQDQRYFIDHHSFIYYKGVVVDWTVLNHPPKYYDIDQYFGVAFPARTVLDAMDELVLENKRVPTVPLMVLKNK